jgi:hypothetical protein
MMSLRVLRWTSSKNPGAQGGLGIVLIGKIRLQNENDKPSESLYSEAEVEPAPDFTYYTCNFVSGAVRAIFDGLP